MSWKVMLHEAKHLLMLIKEDVGTPIGKIFCASCCPAKFCAWFLYDCQLVKLLFKALAQFRLHTTPHFS